MPDTTLRDDIARVLNHHSAENGSNTPDFILAEYLRSCLAAFDAAVTARAQWFGRTDDPRYERRDAMTTPEPVSVDEPDNPDHRAVIVAVLATTGYHDPLAGKLADQIPAALDRAGWRPNHPAVEAIRTLRQHLGHTTQRWEDAVPAAVAEMKQLGEQLDFALIAGVDLLHERSAAQRERDQLAAEVERLKAQLDTRSST